MKKQVDEQSEEDEVELLALKKMLSEKYETKKFLKQPARHSLDISSCSNLKINEDPINPIIEKRKVIGYKTKTVSERVYGDKVNMQMEAYNEISSTNPNNIYIPIDICIE